MLAIWPVLEDASIHNDGFYLAGNTLKAGSNVVIYGTGTCFEESVSCLVFLLSENMRSRVEPLPYEQADTWRVLVQAPRLSIRVAASPIVELLAPAVAAAVSLLFSIQSITDAHRFVTCLLGELHPTSKCSSS